MSELIKTRFRQIQLPKTIAVPGTFVDTIIHLEDNYEHLTVHVAILSVSATSINVSLGVNSTLYDDTLWTILPDPAIGAIFNGVTFPGVAYFSYNTQAVFRRMRLQVTCTGGAATASVRYCPMLRLATGV